MSEQENKTPTAVEIERQLREQRQIELEQAAQDETESAPGESSTKLGIDKLKKSRKGLIVIIAAFILLAAGLTMYFIPSIIRSVSSKDEKPATQSVATGTFKRETGLSDDTDPFNTQQKPSQASAESSSGHKETPPQSAQQSYSRALDVSYGGSNTSTASSSTSGRAASESKVEEQDSTEPDVKPVSAGSSVSLSKITRVPYDPNLFIPEMTSIPCSLDRRFVSDLAGKLVCTVNTDIYSANRNVKLIEKGTAAYLIYKSGTLKHGQGAVFIQATKLRTRREPFIDIPLIDTQAAGALGEAGASGWIDTHFSERFTGAMMLGVVPDVAQWASGAANNNKDNQTDYTSNSRQAFAGIAQEAFSNTVNIPPTLYKNQGEIINLVVGQDLDFSSIYKLKMVDSRR